MKPPKARRQVEPAPTLHPEPLADPLPLDDVIPGPRSPQQLGRLGALRREGNRAEREPRVELGGPGAGAKADPMKPAPATNGNWRPRTEVF